MVVAGGGGVSSIWLGRSGGGHGRRWKWGETRVSNAAAAAAADRVEDMDVNSHDHMTTPKRPIQRRKESKLNLQLLPATANRRNGNRLHSSLCESLIRAQVQAPVPLRTIVSANRGLGDNRCPTFHASFTKIATQGPIFRLEEARRYLPAM